MPKRVRYIFFYDRLTRNFDKHKTSTFVRLFVATTSTSSGVRSQSPQILSLSNPALTESNYHPRCDIIPSFRVRGIILLQFFRCL